MALTEAKMKAKAQALLDYCVANSTDAADLVEGLVHTMNALNVHLQAAQERSAARFSHWLSLSRAGRLIEKTDDKAKK